MTGKKLKYLKKAIGSGIDKKTNLHVLYRYLADHYVTKYTVKRREKKQQEKWSHKGSIKLTHITLYSVTNAGDNFLSECIRILFEWKFGNINWNLISLFDTVNDEYIEKINKSDGVIVGGHGAFLPDTNENSISGWEWPCNKDDYFRINQRLIIFAIGYNYFKGQNRSKLFEENINSLLERADFFGLRNNGSIGKVREFVREELSCKPVFQPCPTMVTRCFYPNLPEKKTTNKIAFNVALDRADKRMGGKEEIILSEIARSMKVLSTRGYEIHFITHCDWEIRFIEYIDREKFPYKYHHGTMWEADRIINFYNEMDMVIGMRGHGIWIPFGVNCHILALGNQDKTRWFLEDIKAEDWNIDILQEPHTLSNQIINKFDEIHIKHGKETTQRLISAQKELWNITCQNMDKIAKLISQ